MDIKQLDEKVSVSAQIAIADIEELGRRGFATLICNRPDGEDEGQPDFSDVAAAARAAGMEAVFQPVTAATMGADHARSFAEAVNASDGPVLAYCRTGTRCTMLWTISGLMTGIPASQLQEGASRAGYDMTNLLRSLQG